MSIAAILIAIPVGIVQASFFEWAFHRYWLHRPWLPKDCFTNHTLIHHQVCKYDDTFQVTEEEQHESLTFAWWGAPVLIAINMLPWAVIAWMVSLAGVALPYAAFTLTIGAVVLVYYIGYEGFHYLMHKPSLGWIERSRPFQFLEKHHRIHHVRMNRNLNVLLPLADLMLGTYVSEMPAVGATPGSARKMARRHSRFGQRLRDGAEAPDPVNGNGSTKGELLGRNSETVVPQEAERAEATRQGE